MYSESREVFDEYIIITIYVILYFNRYLFLTVRKYEKKTVPSLHPACMKMDFYANVQVYRLLF